MKYLPLIALALSLFSCFEKGDCTDISSNKMKVNFYKFSDKKSKKILIDSIIIEGWEDSVMYKNEVDSITTVLLPLDPAVKEMTYYLYYQNKIATLDIDYISHTFPLAPECKVIDLLTLTDAAATVVQELTISQHELTSNETENIKLYF